MGAEAITDRWLAWLTDGRDARSPEVRRRSLELLLPIRDEVLRAAELRAGQTVLDVGAGEGLLGVAALEQVGADGRVIFSDVSPAVVDHVRRGTEKLGLQHRAAFVVADAATLDRIADGSVDVVLMRSVLIYVDDPAQAARAFARVLRPDGRVSLFEPLNSITRDPTGNSFVGYDTTPVAEETRAVYDVYDRSQPPSDPMLTLSTAGLVADFEQAAFVTIEARESVSSAAPPPADDTAITGLLHGKPNPLAPSVSEAAREALDSDASRRFLDTLVDAARSGRGRRRQAHLYLAARLGS